MKKILVIQQKMIGDVLASTIICEVLKEQYPNSIVHYMVHSNTIPVVLGNPNIDKIIEFTPKHKNSKTAYIKLTKSIREAKYDWVIDAYGKIESTIITFISGAKKRTSFHKWYTKFYYSDTIKTKSKVYKFSGKALNDRLRLVLPEEQIINSSYRPKIYLSEEEKKEAKDFLIRNDISFEKPLIMIGILGSNLTKSLPFATMAAIIDFIAEKTQADILFNYIPSQEIDAKRIYELTKETTKKQIHFNLYGKSLRSFISILSHCNIMIGNEGGAVNMAKALFVPTFTVFSPWVAKNAWNMFEDGKTNVSVHLQDFEPEIYGENLPKEFKNQALVLYKKLSASRIIPKLNDYLDNLEP